jgi:hypothetical protein
MLDRAKTHLRGFAVVGFFDDLHDFAARLDLSVPQSVVGHFKSSFVPTDDDLLEARERNAVDVLLYDWAKKQFGQHPS